MWSLGINMWVQFLRPNAGERISSTWPEGCIPVQRGKQGQLWPKTTFFYPYNEVIVPLSQNKPLEASPALEPYDVYGKLAHSSNVSALEPYIQALSQMAPANREMVLNLIRTLAEIDNEPLSRTSASGLQLPEEGIPLWLASLKAEQYSPRTIREYRRIVGYYLKSDPRPTLLSIQSYLA